MLAYHATTASHFHVSVESVSMNLHFTVMLVSCSISTARSIYLYSENYSIFLSAIAYKKAVLSQRWPRNAPYRPTWVHWKFSGIPDYAHGYYSQHFSWSFVRIDPMNVPTKFEVRSFTRSWDNRGYPKNLGTPRIRPLSQRPSSY